MDGNFGWLLFGLAIACAVYFAPWYVAATRRHPSFVAIATLNLLLGWTVLGWIIALIWSLTAIPRSAPAPHPQSPRATRG